MHFETFGKNPHISNKSDIRRILQTENFKLFDFILVLFWRDSSPLLISSPAPRNDLLLVNTVM